MLVIRRMVDRHQAYTAIFLPGEEPRIFPTSDYEHARILQIYLQDRPHPGICNDFTNLEAAPAAPPPKEKKVAQSRPPRRQRKR